jgi:dephospho-CoA kinase
VVPLSQARLERAGSIEVFAPDRRARTVVIGLTGPIGCGKSTIAGWLAERGAVVIDADEIAREVVEPGEPALEAVLARFGDGYRHADGSLDREALARLVFSDPGALRDLEAIVHPAVRPRIEQRVAAASTWPGRAVAVVVEAIKLVEAGYAVRCDEVWLVTCTPDVQRGRLLGRGVSEDDAERRIRAQAGSADVVRAAATRIIDASGPRSAVEAEVEAAFREALGRASAAR